MYLTYSHFQMIMEFYEKQRDIQTIFDYGSGHGNISYHLKNKLDKEVSAFDIEKSLFSRYEHYYRQIKYYADKSEIQSLIKQNIKYDSVLCSLVLCHNLANTMVQSNRIIESIMQDIVSLSKRHILIVICNPLFLMGNSAIQKRLVDKNHFYSQELCYDKYIFTTNNIRKDIHRPLKFYENLFAKYHLEIRQILQSNNSCSKTTIIENSDFMMFDLIKEKYK